MGNCIFAGKKLFNQCYNNLGQSGKPSPEFDSLIGKENNRGAKPYVKVFSKKIFYFRSKGSRNIISEYMSWALSHSHSPLVFDDTMSHSSVSSHFDESNVAISSSWISDGAHSDASHVLYKELDPLNRAASVELDKENSDSLGNMASQKEGSWITVAEPSDGKYGASSSISHYIMHPNIERTSASGHKDDKNAVTHTLIEEVDGLELARLARRLWDQSRHRYSRSSQANEKVTNTVNSKSASFVRPTILSLRSTPQTVLPSVPKTEAPKTIYFESPDMDSAFDLAWDHEMDLDMSNAETRRSLGKNTAQRAIPRDFNNDETSSNSFITRNPFDERRRRPLATASTQNASYSQTQSVAILPVRNDGYNPIVDSRWIPSDKLPGGGNTRSSVKKPLSSETAIPCSDLILSPTYNTINTDNSQTIGKNTSKLLFSDNLVDSGFVGGGNSTIISSFSDFDDIADDDVVDTEKQGSLGTLPIDHSSEHLSDFLWEHELFSPQTFKPKSIHCPTNVH
ncbi:unnamed protein product [Trichobilharzia szidati]|nr:unnamed protein product [Trichobilharzia szidati]